VIFTTDAVCGPHANQHHFKHFISQRCAVRQIFLVPLETPDRHSVLVAEIPVKVLIRIEYTEVFRCSHSQNPRALSSGDGTSQLAGSVLSTVVRVFDNAEKLSWRPVLPEP
jgi:hypothetical protein